MQTEQDVLERIRQGESAYDLLREEMPTAEKRFRKLCRDMERFIKDVNKVFPDAEYYTGSGGFNLLLGSSHSLVDLKPQQELVALSNLRRFSIGDGDW